MYNLFKAKFSLKNIVLEVNMSFQGLGRARPGESSRAVRWMLYFFGDYFNKIGAFLC
jgi:hypothetical protein